MKGIAAVKTVGKALRGGARVASREAGKERSRWLEFGKAAENLVIRVPKELLLTVVKIVPQFLVLLLNISKSKRADAKLKITLVGAILVIAAILGVEVSGVGRWFWFVTLTALFGPISGLGAIVGYELLNAAVLVILVIVTCTICMEVIGNENLEKIAIELWGKENGSSFIDTLFALVNKLQRWVSPLRSAMEKLFYFVGKTYRKKGTDEGLSETVEKSGTSAKDLARELAKTKRKKVQQPNTRRQAKGVRASK